MPSAGKLQFIAPATRMSSGFETIVIGAIFICAMYFGKALLLPLTLAIFLTFLLSPVVSKLRRLHVPKLLAVALATLSAASILLAVALMLGQQVRTFAEELPRYQYVLSEKIHVLKHLATSNTQLDRAGETLKVLRDEIVGPAPAAATPGGTAIRSAPSAEQAPPKPTSVVIDDRKSSLDRLWSTLEAALEPLTTAGIAVIFVVILLLDRQDVRDRAIRLLGVNDLERTTRAMDDAGSRLKRYFLAATAVNSAFGLVIGIGLWWIGVPNPLLWGVIAMFMRFIPFVGILLSATLPIMLAMTVDPGWTMVAWTIGLFVVSEILVSQVVETVVHGQSTGLSPLAIILATAFWTLLWGPVGLVLAVPLTVTLVVLGRHVERFSFLDILLGSQPALSPADSFYQRILAGDHEEAAEQASEKLKDLTPDAYYDGVVMEALSKAAFDLKAGNLDAGRLSEISTSLEEFVADIGELVDGGMPSTKSANQPGRDNGEVAAGLHHKPPVVCMPARTLIDRAAALILAQLLTLRSIPAVVATSDDLLRGEVNGVDLTKTELICLSSFLSRERSAQLKFLVRKLHRRMPAAEILGCFWQANGNVGATPDDSVELGVDDVVATFSAAVDVAILKDQGTSIKPLGEVRQPSTGAAMVAA